MKPLIFFCITLFSVNIFGESKDSIVYNKLREYFEAEQYEKVLNYATKEAAKGSADAINALGVLYCHGLGVEADSEKALAFFKKASEEGSISALFNIGLVYYQGINVKENNEEAFKWFTKAVEKGNEDALYYIGEMYYFGYGVDEDKTEAFKWFIKAAENGDDDAQYHIGEMYYFGYGMDEDKTEAFKWLTKAAENGNDAAQYILGYMYLNGEVVQKNDTEAYKYYRKSSESGNNIATSKLMVDSLTNIKKYEEALVYVDNLEEFQLVDTQTLNNCVICFEKLRKYKECIDFCDNRLRLFPEDDYLLYYLTKGECFYLLNEYEKAHEYMTIYINEAEGNNLIVGTYETGLYAEILYETYQFTKAEKYFKIYFETILEENNSSLESLCSSDLSNIYGYKFYNYAYSCFYQGKENEGLKYLILSKKCNNKLAIDDCKILENNATFAKDIKYKSSTIADFNKYILMYDIPKDSIKRNASSFWTNMLSHNKQYQELNKALDRKNKPGTLIMALYELKKSQPEIKYALEECYPYEVGSTEKDLKKQLFLNNPLLKDLRVYHADDPNAFATPNGEIYLTDGLVKLYHFNTTLLLGVCAHELTHYLCRHSLVGLWKQAKKEKRNEIWAGVTVGLNSVAQGVGAMYGASAGISYDQSYWDNVSTINTNLIQGFKEDAFYFQFKYTRSQELESDIIAYRFCEEMGIGGYVYIMALQLLGDVNGYLKASKVSDHPTNAFRIGLLKYLYAKEHPNNT